MAAVAALSVAQPGSESPPNAELVVALGAEPRSLDPHVTTAVSDFQVMENLYEGLVRFRRGTLDIEPALAESWSISKDGLRYRFQLKKGVRFHDNSEFDAEVVRWNLARLIDPSHPAADTGPFPLAFFFESVGELIVRGRYEIELVLKEPFAPLLGNLAYPTGFLVSPAAVARHGKGFGRLPAGTGPYRLVEWRAGRRLRLERYAGYWGEPARTPSVVFRSIKDQMTRLAELRAETVDLAVELPADSLAAFRGAERFVVHESTGPHLWFVLLNTSIPPFSDVRVRRAVNLAVDKRGLVERVLAGTATVAAGPIPEAFAWASEPSLEPYPFDPDRARELIREAGHEGVTITLLAPESGSGMLSPLPMAAAIQADLARVGLSVRIETYDFQSFLTKVNAGLGDQVDMAEMAWMTNDPDTLPYLALRSAAFPPGGFNSGYYQNPDVDALLEQARRSTSREERARLYRRVARLVHDDAPWLFVASAKESIVARANVAGFAAEPSFFLLLAGAHKR